MGKENDVIEFIHGVNNLKTTQRAGWVKRGIESPESVADHSFGTAMLALILAPGAKIDNIKAVKMALIHDLAESKIGDITPSDGVSKKEKYILEETAITELFENLDHGKDLIALWREFETGETKEAKFVKRLDKLEMMFQAHEYEITQKRVDLSEFWDDTENFNFGEVQQIYIQLRKLRK